MTTIEQEEGGRIDYLRSVLVAAKGSVGSTEYRCVFIKRAYGAIEDVIRNGELACAFSTSSIFHRFGLLTSTHTTVSGLEKEIIESPDWTEVRSAKMGAIGILEPKRDLSGKTGNRHTFICIGGGQAVHNDSTPGIRSPQIILIRNFKHHTNEKRAVERYFIHKKLLM